MFGANACILHGSSSAPQGPRGERPSAAVTLYRGTSLSYIMGFGKDGKGVIIWDNSSIGALSTLAGVTGIVAAGPVLTEGFRQLKSQIWPALTGLTNGEGVWFGIAAADMSLTNVEAAIESAVLTRGDVIANKNAQLPVWPLHLFIGGDEQAVHLEMKLGWTFPEESGGWQWWVYNPSAGALATGAGMRVVAKHFGVWV